MAGTMTRAQRQELAKMLMDQAGNLVEFWGEYRDRCPGMENVEGSEVAEVLGQWLARLPGTSWDTRLVDPNS